jgi:hypothetical protein
MLHISNGRYGLTSTCDGADVDPFILHLFAALAGKDDRTRTKAAHAAAKARGVKLVARSSRRRVQTATEPTCFRSFARYNAQGLPRFTR